MSEIKQCEPYCRDGTVMPPGLKQFDTYKCGPETNYDWIPVDWFPACQGAFNIKHKIHLFLE